MPRGEEADTFQETICGLGNRMQNIFLDLLDEAVPALESTVDLLRGLEDAGIATGIYSPSHDCQRVLRAADIENLFAVRVDGVIAGGLALAGKPELAVFFEITRRLAANPSRSVLVVDAEAGVEAGHKGGFSVVVGVDRSGRTNELLACGADVVVDDLSHVEIRKGDKSVAQLPDALSSYGQLVGFVAGREPFVCSRLRRDAVGDRLGPRRGHACRRRGQSLGALGGAVPGGDSERPGSGGHPRPGRPTWDLVCRQPRL